MRQSLFAVISIALGVAVPLVTAELVLRFFPVSTGLGSQPVDAENPVFRFTPDSTYVWSKGWDFSIVNRGRINNAGFVNDRDYRTDASTPLLAIIGDSYVEAAMVPYPETLQGRLARIVEGQGRVYSFAASGAPLSQYLIWAQHARDQYRPDAMVFVIVANDFDESLLAYKQGPGFHHYHEGTDGTLRLVRVDYTPSPLRQALRLSALVRYAFFNLEAPAAAPRLRAVMQARADDAEPKEHLGNVPRTVPTKQLTDAKRAVDAFFRDLPEMSGLPSDRILFVVDGVRYPQNSDPEAFFPKMRTYFLKRAAALGYGAIDMDRVFMPEHAANATRFEFPTDGHWNANGHRFAAEAVAGSSVFGEVFGTPSAEGL